MFPKFQFVTGHFFLAQPQKFKLI